MADRETLFLSTTPGLEGPLLAEAALLGQVKPVAGGVLLEGPPGVHRRANLILATASRVLLQVGRVSASDSRTLACGLRELPLDRYLSRKAAPQIEAVSRGGLPERPLEAAGRSLGLGGARLRLRSDPEGVAVAVDTSGELLHRRGYRQEGSRAPLRETLAAGLLALAGHEPGTPLWDPLCGSGTILIEAALRGRRLAPGRHRRFAFERFPAHDGAAYAQEQEALAAEALARCPAVLRGSDLNAGALGTARRNAGRAGVADDLHLVRHDATVAVRDLLPGSLVVANLPYGLRVGEAEGLPALYKALARAVRRAGAARVAFLVNASRAVDWLELPEALVLPVENGGLRCQLILAALV